MAVNRGIADAFLFGRDKARISISHSPAIEPHSSNINRRGCPFLPSTTAIISFQRSARDSAPPRDRYLLRNRSNSLDPTYITESDCKLIGQACSLRILSSISRVRIVCLASVVEGSIVPRLDICLDPPKKKKKKKKRERSETSNLRSSTSELCFTTTRFLVRSQQISRRCGKMVS